MIRTTSRGWSDPIAAVILTNLADAAAGAWSLDFAIVIADTDRRRKDAHCDTLLRRLWRDVPANTDSLVRTFGTLRSLVAFGTIAPLGSFLTFAPFGPVLAFGALGPVPILSVPILTVTVLAIAVAAGRGALVLAFVVIAGLIICVGRVIVIVAIFVVTRTTLVLLLEA